MRLFRFLLLPTITALSLYCLNAFAATPAQIIITWQAQSYAPASYQGKILPGATSAIKASLQILDSDRAVDASGYEVRWSFAGVPLTSGAGKASISFNDAASRYGGVQALEARVRRYKGGADLIGSAIIPRSQPIVVLNAPYPNHQLLSSMDLIALPYFFNITSLSDLVFEWKANELTSAGSPGASDHLTFAIPKVTSQAAVTVTVRASSAKTDEVAESSVTFSHP